MMAGFLALFNEPERVVVAKGFWIDIKKGLTAEDYEGAQRALLGKMSMNNDGLSAEPDTVAYQHELVFRAITDWNLTDENDQLLPLEPKTAKHESIRRLPQFVFVDLYERINNAASPRSQADEVSFRDGGEGRDSGNQNADDSADASKVSD